MIIEKPQDKLILASSSERRISLLKKLGLEFIAVNHKIEKEPKFSSDKNQSVEQFVKGLALMKAKSLKNDYPDNCIIGSDTVIYLDGNVYGKPSDFKDAFDMLKSLSGKTHKVYTGVSLYSYGRNICETEYDTTMVKIKSLSNSEIEDYIRKYPPYDKAGSYGIQDEDGIIGHYEGSFENVLGLCVQKLIPLLNKLYVAELRLCQDMK